eukprot:6199002-Pleurochrysis_carterae.AAC.4
MIPTVLFLLCEPDVANKLGLFARPRVMHAPEDYVLEEYGCAQLSLTRRIFHFTSRRPIRHRGNTSS